MKTESMIARQRVDAHRRQVSNIPPSMNSFTQSCRADMESKTPNRPDKSQGVACGIEVEVVSLGIVLIMLVPERLKQN